MLNVLWLIKKILTSSLDSFEFSKWMIFQIQIEDFKTATKLALKTGLKMLKVYFLLFSVAIISNVFFKFIFLLELKSHSVQFE